MDDDYTLDYAPSAVQHLGVGLYKQLPQALAELITNSWDADATRVNIAINYSERNITVSDNGLGMTHEELNKDFLRVAKNRRLKNKSDLSPSGRKVTGKKGLGKLALFGIADRIQVFSVKDGLENAFEMNFKVIKNTDEDEKYHPKTILNNFKTKKKNGTKIVITDLTLKNITKIDVLKDSLSRRFNKYSRDAFLVKISDNNNQTFFLDESAFESSVLPNHVEFTYHFPEDFNADIKNSNVLRELINSNVTGTVFTQITPLKSIEQGFYVLSRGKLASERSTHQFSDRANDSFYSYATGYFNIDFIDSSIEEDYISTDRQNILWDSNEDLIHLRNNLSTLVNIIQKKWRLDRKYARDKKKEQAKSSIPLLTEVVTSPNFSKNDRKNINSTIDILENDDVVISERKKKKILELTAKRTEAYEKDNSVYKELIPSNFRVPNSVSSKIRRFREEAGNATTDKDNRDKFILTQGLLLRGLIDSTTSTLIFKNLDELHSLEILNSHIKNQKNAYNMKLKDKLNTTIEFLDKKDCLPNSKSAAVLKNEIGSLLVVSKLDQLMHDANQWPKFNELKQMWDLMAPILMDAFTFIENK